MYTHAALGGSNSRWNYFGNCHPSHMTTTVASTVVDRQSGPGRVAVRLFPRAEASQNESHAPQSAHNV
jgi:hypothetical protein